MTIATTETRDAARERALAYWTERLAGAPARLELPADRPGAAPAAGGRAREPVSLPGALRERLDALARAEGATLHEALLAGLHALLAGYAGSGDVVVASPVAAARGDGAGPSAPLPLRADLSGDPTLRQVLGRAREAARGAREHADIPAGALRSLRGAGEPLAQVLLTLHGAEGAAAEEEDFELHLHLDDASGGLSGALAYDPAHFDRDTVRRMAGHLARVLERLAGEPGSRLSEVEPMDEAERRRVVDEWNRTDAELPAGLCLHQLVEARAERTPDAAALVFED
jgi:non-ribosomal peptide synthetase component F